MRDPDLTAFICGSASAAVHARRGIHVALAAAVVDRRRAARYAFCTLVPAGLSFVQDAVLETFDGVQASMVTSQPATPGDEVVMLFRSPAGAVRCVMQVCSSTPIVWGTSGGYRLELRTSDVANAPPQLALVSQL